MLNYRAIALVSAAFLAGCGGAVAPLSGRESTSDSRSHASFVIKVPARAPASAASRTPKFISPSTQSITIVVDSGAPIVANLTPTSAGCTTSAQGLACTVVATVTLGTHAFTLTTYDAANGTGHALSTNTLAGQVVTAAGPNIFPVVLGGVVGAIAIALSPAMPPVGSPATVTVTVTASDADGNAIIGPGSYANGPIILTNSDTSGATTLSETSVPGPTSAITLAYNGSSSITSATITATLAAVPTIKTTPAVLTPLKAVQSGSNALGIYTAPNGMTYGFVPNPTGVAEVSVANGVALLARTHDGIRTATAPIPVQIPLSPAPDACSVDSTDALLFCYSFTSPTINVLSLASVPTPTVLATYTTDATANTGNSSGECVICGAAWDTLDKQLIIATGNGYELYSGPTATTPNAHLATVAAYVSENFGYDGVSDVIFSPQYSAGSPSIQALPLPGSTISTLMPVPNGIEEPDAGAVDVLTNIGISPEEFTNAYYNDAPSDTTNTLYMVNMGKAAFDSTSAQFTAPITTLTLSSGLFGFPTATTCDVPITNVAIDSAKHLAFFSGEFCGQQQADFLSVDSGSATPVGVAQLPTTSSGSLAFGDSVFANLPPLPDGTLWDDALDPHAVAAFNLPGACQDCAAVFNYETTWMAVVDLNKLLAAPRSSTDPHTVDPTYDLLGNGVVTYFATGTTPKSFAIRQTSRIRQPRAWHRR